MLAARKALPRLLQTLALAALAATAVATFVPTHSQAHSGLVLRGFGTATVDGALSSGEWDGAGRVELAAAAPAADGGGTIPTLLLAMNDATTLYLAVRLAEPSFQRSPFSSFEFDNDHDGVREEGDDLIEVSRGQHTITNFFDEFRFH